MIKTTLLPAIMVMMAVHISDQSFAQMKMEHKNSISESGAVILKTNMRHLWEDHITWTRNVIFCLVGDLPGADQAVKRLLQNQIDIGNAIKPYYGEEAGKK